MFLSIPVAITVSLLGLWMVSTAEGCLPTHEGHKTLEERLQEADLVVYATAHSIRIHPGFRVLETIVQCVLKNTNSTTVNGTLEIGEELGPSCIRNIDLVDLAGDYVIMIQRTSYDIFGSQVFSFDSVNGQVAIAGNVDVLPLMCSHFGHYAPPSFPEEGTTCPTIKLTCSVGVLQQNIATIIALVLISGMILYY